ncbi:unnamed protein product [Brassica rapa]|uniref:Uncharacterized protein n=1 Tax=Brassica campestris TaxID=3711 RepID=A0A8D9HLQ6_BRACM|nr:unnamed protein product [Brassica rapa]
MNPNGESPVSGDLISKKPNGKDGVSSDEPIKCTGQNVVSSAKAVSGDPLSKKPNGKAVVSSAEPITHSSGTGVPKSQPISSCPSLPYLPFNGGDLIKWVKARIWLYVVIDIAEGSVELDKILEEDAPIVICSCQFDMQYSWTTEARARRALAINSNLAAPLVSNTSFTLRMLLIALNGLSFNIFKSLAEEYDLELVFMKNSHEVVHELGALGDGNQDQSKSLSYEWDAAYLYLSFVLRKRGESDGGQRRVGKRKNGKMNLSKDDVLYIDNESVKECNFTQQRVS